MSLLDMTQFDRIGLNIAAGRSAAATDHAAPARAPQRATRRLVDVIAEQLELASDSYPHIPLTATVASTVTPRARPLPPDDLHRDRLRDLAAVTHPYPTWADGPWNAALAEVSAAMQRPGTRWALRRTLAARRRLPPRRPRYRR